MIVYLARDIPAFVMYCVNGESGSSLLIESTDSMIATCFSIGTLFGINIAYSIITYKDAINPRKISRESQVVMSHLQGWLK